MKMTHWLGLALFSLVLGIGCTRPKTVMDFRVPPKADPGGTKTAVISKVTDQRKFEATPSAPAGATTANKEELTNPAITIRTIGEAHGHSDIILPEGRTAEMVVREAVQNALRGKGYSVVPEGTSATPGLEVEIRKYWLWFTPGVWVITIYFEAEVAIKGPMVLSGQEEIITAKHEMSSPLAVIGMYTGTIEQGNEILIENIKAKLKQP